MFSPTPPPPSPGKSLFRPIHKSIIASKTRKPRGARGAAPRLTGAIVLLLTLTILFGCGRSPESVTVHNQGNGVDIPLPTAEQLRAIEDEKHENYRAALLYWRQAEGVIDEKIHSISSELKKISNEHAQNGIIYFEGKKEDKARHEFLESLRYFPENRIALDYLNNRYAIGSYIRYTVQKEDTPLTIAESVYGSPAYEFAVTNFSDLRGDTLVEGAPLSLAVLDSFYSPALKDYKKNIRAARSLYSARSYEEVLPLAEMILEDNPGDNEASYILNMSLLRYSEDLQKQERFEQAIELLQRVDPSFKNVKPMTEEIRRAQKKQVAQETVVANSEYYQQGKRLFLEGRSLEALELYQQIDPSYPGVDKAIEDVKEQLKIEAEYHFKEGVKHFVDEDLAGAISEWEQALRLNPDHSNAKNSLEKARGLLKKVEEIEGTNPGT